MIYFFKHLLLILICLELIITFIFFNLFKILLLFEFNLFYLIFFLIIIVCEGALGLTLIVVLVRFKGNDYLNSLSLLKW